MKRIIISLVFLLLAPVSYAGLHIEPYVSGGGSYSSTISSNPIIFMNFTGGARLGWRFLSLSAGVDLFWTHFNTGSSSSLQHLEVYHSSEPTKGFSQAGNSVSLQYSESRDPFQPFSVGAFVAVDLPLLFNAYGSAFYSFGNKSNISHQGYGAKAGVSYLSSFFAQLNLELQWVNYMCQEQARCSGSGFDIMSVALSVSVPIPTGAGDFASGLFNFDDGSSDSEEVAEEGDDSSTDEDSSLSADSSNEDSSSAEGSAGYSF